MKLGDIADIVPGFAFSEVYQGHTNLPTPFIKVSDFARAQNSWIHDAANTVDDALLKTMRAKSYPPGTIIFPKVGGALLTNKRARIAVRSSFDNNVMGIIPRGVDGDYLYWFMCQFDMAQLANTQALPSVRASDVAQIDIPVPEKEEQRRIAARLKAQLAEVDTARQAVQAGLRDADALRQRLLQHAFDGVENSPRKKLSSVAQINPRRASISRSDYSPTSFVPMAAVDETFGEVTQILAQPYSKLKKGYTYFENGDVIFAKITPCMQNGKHAIVRNLIDGFGFGSTEFHVIRPSEEIIPEWIHYYLRRQETLGAAIKTFTGAVGQQRVPPAFLENLDIPVPLPDQQRRFAARLKAQLAEADTLRTALQRQQRELDALPQRILAQAFDGSMALLS